MREEKLELKRKRLTRMQTIKLKMRHYIDIAPKIHNKQKQEAKSIDYKLALA